MRSAIRCLVAAVFLLSACAAPSADSGGRITVFAAASLTEGFGELGELFEAANPGVTVEFAFAGSSTLAAQIRSGAPADVFAAASPVHLTTLVDAGLATAPAAFATNRLQIAVPPDNPAGISGLADLSDPDVVLAVCDPLVPCGAATETVFEIAGIAPEPDTRERDVKAVLTKVRLGEVDAGLVYRTDVHAAAGDVTGIEFPESAEAVNVYPIATLTDAPDPVTAAAFVDFVRSQTGRDVLAEAGFGTP
ncbi:molybdate transport system substrate-binding protein [Stackebrandtia albiflava]|uniref:Molybdate transport system substrate-binding protein n=1 Tax=Stackebrandtia albiflava TaxID=406432 RepID=A0A562UYI8_9ACTN|nr:molybdate ABC transporter substrate-binding protein [Stackebrandtia albiflava]TWJ10663.1 molybdate transport system substrate-binding protein [Stackebrandtia albiflava]